MNLELHPLCTLFPRMDGIEFDSLKADISVNGLRHPVVIHDGFILDGGNRYRACVELGIDADYIDFDGDDIVSYVLSTNLHRRHMSAGQRAVIVSSATNWSVAASHGGKRVQAANLPLETVADRAALSGASERTQRTADKLAKENPEEAKNVAHERKSLYRAAQESKSEKITPEIIAEEPEYFGPSEYEIERDSKAESDQLEYIKNLLSTEDDPLVKALSDVKLYREQIRVLTGRYNEANNKANELIRMVKSLQSKLAKIGEK